MQSTTPTYRYRVDAEDVLVWVDSWWLAFAAENGADELTEAAVLGRPLWDCIADDATCTVYRQLHRRVREQGKPVVVSFRCDSPTVRRHMRLTISRDEAAQLAYESVLVKAEPTRYLAALDCRAERGGEVLTLCSCCKQALVEPAGWLALEDAAARLRLFEQSPGPQLRYTICPECAQCVSAANDNGGAA